MRAGRATTEYDRRTLSDRESMASDGRGGGKRRKENEAPTRREGRSEQIAGDFPFSMASCAVWLRATARQGIDAAAGGIAVKTLRWKTRKSGFGD
jgi:hypothetical protein